jgi:hypothetical protein
MTRPALIVGAGGTGQWVLVYTKKNLLEASDDGKLPPSVRLLSIDAHKAPGEGKSFSLGGESSGASTNGSAAPDTDNIRIGDIQLDPSTEYLGVTGDLTEIAREISANSGRPGYSFNWFPAAHFLNAKVNLDIQTGCGQSRPLGRLAFFHWRHLISNRIDSALRDFDRDIHRFNSQNRFEVMLALSWSGGTGAGMYLDLAYLLRERVRAKFGENFFLRGFIVLPHHMMSIAGGANAAMARGFAAWRELDRYMRAGHVGATFGTPITYLDEDQTTVDQRPFDAAYLVSPERPTNSLAGLRPEDALYPSVAEAIVAMLDETVGAHYTAAVQTNLFPIYVDPVNTGSAFYSSIGTVSYNVPRHLIREQYKYGLAIDWLTSFLGVDTSSSQPKLRNNANQVAGPGDDGTMLKHFSDLLTAPAVEAGGQSAANTGLFPWIAQLVERLEQAVNEEALLAPATLPNTGSAPHPWEAPFTAALGDAGFAGLATKTKQARGKMNLRQYIGGNGGQILQYHPKVASDALPRKYEELEAQLFGNMAVDDKQSQVLTGEYARSLQDLEERHVAIYTDRLRIRLHEILNGADAITDVNPSQARAGRLGYARSLAHALASRWQIFVEFCDKARSARATKPGGTTDLRRQRDARTTAFRKGAQETSRWARKVPGHEDLGGPTENAYKSVDSFVDYWQSYLNTRAGDVVLSRVEGTAKRCLQVTNGLRDDLDQVAEFYVTSPGSVFQKLRIQQGTITEGAHDDAALRRVIRIAVPRPYAALGDVQKTEVLDKFCSKARWAVGLPDQDGSWSIALQLAADNGILVAQRTSGLRSGQTPVDDAVSTIRRLAAPYVEGIKPYAPIAPILHSTVKPEDLFQMIRDDGEPLYLPSSLARARERAKAQIHYMRISREALIGGNEQDSAAAMAWLGNIESAIKLAHPGVTLPLGAVNWDSDDPYRFTSVRTDEAIAADGFDARRRLRTAYLKEIRDRMGGDGDSRLAEATVTAARLLHNFPAEVHAMNYEIQVANRFQRQYTEFDARIVTLLEYPNLLQLYLVCKACKLIQEIERQREDGSYEYAWILDFSPDERPIDNARINSPAMGRLLFLTEWRSRSDHEKLLNRELEDRAHRFVIVRKDARPNVAVTVTPATLNQVIMQRFAPTEGKKDQLVAALRDEIQADGGFIHEWQNQEAGSMLETMGLLSQILLEGWVADRFKVKLVEDMFATDPYHGSPAI